MVSLDDAEKNKAFAESVGASFVLLSDPEKENAEKYGVLGLGGFYTKRFTYYIDRNGILREIVGRGKLDRMIPDLLAESTS